MNCSNCQLFNRTSNFTNLTTARTPTTVAPVPGALFIAIFTYVDYVNRILSTLAFVIYFLLVLRFKELRTLNLLYVHHANLVGFAFVFMYIVYFNTSMPNSTDPKLNDLLCKITECFWGVLKYLRSYSVLLIALYRLAAVYYMEFFKVLNKSYLNITLPILVIWLLSGGLFVSTKFGFRTTYGNLFCIDGYSPNFDDTLNYLIVSSLLCIVLPCTLITVIYLAIRRILAKNSTRVGNKSGTMSASFADPKSLVKVDNRKSVSFAKDSNSFSNAPSRAHASLQSNKSTSSKRTELRKNKRFSLQLISLNFCYLFGFSMSFILSFRYIIPNFNEKFYYFRQILRILNVMFQAMIPIVSLTFNPNITFQRVKASFLGGSSVVPEARSRTAPSVNLK